MNTVQPYVAHFDLDSFFVSVEMLNDPSLKGRPVLVGGSRERGVVAACSYEARAFGIHSAMPMATALRLCPQAVVVKGTRGEYSRYSRIVTSIIAAKAPKFEKASIDEFYIDLTGMDRFFSPFEWTQQLRQEIIDATHLPISFALASSKFVAKIATDFAKPNGYIFIEPGKERDFLAPLPVNKIPGVGDSGFQVLRSMGIAKIADILQFSITDLESQLGKWGIELHQKANGTYYSEVRSHHESKSVSTEQTFQENSSDTSFLLQELVRMTEKVAFELRKEEKLAGCISVKIRYHDFETTSRQTTIDYTFRDDEMIPVAKDLFFKLYRKGAAVRLLGVRLSDLTNHAMQANLFDDAEKKSSLYKAIDSVKTQFGREALQKARTIRRAKDDDDAD